MLKRLVIFAVIVWVGSIAWTQVPRDGSSKNKEAQASKSKGQNPRQPCLCKVQMQEAPAKEQQKTAPKPSSYPWRELYAPANIPNWILSAIGIGGIIAALMTLVGINKQAALMEKTLVLQFRPQLVVRCGVVNTSAEANFDELATGTLDFTIANTGGSDAKILTCEVEVLAFITPPRLTFLHSQQYPSFELKAGESIPRWADLRGEVNEAIRWANAQHPEAIGSAQAKSIYFAGVIWYEDESGVRRSMGFYRNYSPDTKKFVSSGDPDREYSD